MIFPFSQFFRDFEPAATVENLSVAPVPTPEVDLAEFDQDLESMFAAGRQHLAQVRQ